jgi:hypothetical protein
MKNSTNGNGSNARTPISHTAIGGKEEENNSPICDINCKRTLNLNSHDFSNSNQTLDIVKRHLVSVNFLSDTFF